MKITNMHNLPETVYKAVSWVSKPRPDRLSVSDLINPPLMRRLKIQHWDDLEEDASQRLWLLLGQSVHAILEKVNLEDALQEEKIEVDIDGITIVGKPDLWHNGIITDWKVTSVYSFLLGEKKEWTIQLNAYKWLYESIGFPVNELFIYAILRDWTKSKADYENDYPSVPFMSLKVPGCSKDMMDSYIATTVAIHKKAMELPLEQFTSKLICSDEDRWKRPDSWAVKKVGNTRAIRVFNSETEAVDFVGNRKGFEVEYRKGNAIRCENYCIVSKFCPFREERQ